LAFNCSFKKLLTRPFVFENVSENSIQLSTLRTATQTL
jgi:hypothetical protein